MTPVDGLIIALTGPTAAGKTEVALALAERFEVSLISLDSAMVYRGMDIGTAKPERAVLERFPHALIDIRDPAEPYSAASFVADADAEVRRVRALGRTPVLVGGTMLYLKAFREGLAALPSADPGVRARLAREAVELGAAALHERLNAVDPLAARDIHPNNLARVQRALEVFELTGKPISSFWDGSRNLSERLGGRLVEFAILPDHRSHLHERIERRFDAMLAAGFINEVAALKARPDLHADLPAMRAVGYRQAWAWLDGELTLDDLRGRVGAATRQLAKRQLTWLNSWPGVLPLEWGNSARLADEVARRARLAKP